LGEDVNVQTKSRFENERLIYAISAGVVLILVGVVFSLAQPHNLWDKIIDFFNSFTLAEVPGTSFLNSETGLFLPAPITPSAHFILYSAIFQFCLGLGLFQVLLLFVRVKTESQNKKIAETLGSLIYWLATSYLVLRFLNNTTSINDWWVFWAGVLLVLGLSFVARGFFLYAVKK
jgi:multisubunit Na+/H+ antiporter MnhB subunit